MTRASTPDVPWRPDLGLTRQVNDFARSTGWLHPFATAYASYGVLVFGALLILGWWLARRAGSRTQAAALWAGAATLLAVAVNQPLVAAFSEARPYAVLPHLLVLGHRSVDPSFPSDHAVMAGAAAAGLWLSSRRLGVLGAVLAVLMALVRVYVGVHWPHDVVVGLAVGAVVTLLGWLVLGRLLTGLVQRLRRTRLRPLVASADQQRSAALVSSST